MTTPNQGSADARIKDNLIQNLKSLIICQYKGGYMLGVYGDHSTDGWLEWGLEAHFARQRAEGAFTPASNELVMGEAFLESGEAENDARTIQKGKDLIQKAGLLAAAEARAWGYTINGWESEEAEREFRVFYDRRAQDYAAARAAEEARAQGVEIEGFEWPNVETV